MSSTTYIASKYKYLFIVPGASKAIYTLVIVGGFSGLVAQMAAGGEVQAFFSMMISLSILPPLLNLVSKKALIRESRAASLRRLNHLTLLEGYVILAALVTGYAVGSFLSLNNLLTSLTYAALSLTTYIRVTVLSAFDPYASRDHVLAGLLEPFGRASILAALLTSVYDPYSIFASTTIGASSALLSIFILLRPMEGGARPLRLAAGLVDSLLNGEGSALEGMLRPLCVERDGKTELFVFRSKVDGKKIALIIPGFHPGPLRTFGSTLLPYMIERKLKESERGIDALVVKGCSTHENNVATQVISDNIGEEVARALASSSLQYSSEACIYPARNFGRVSVLGLKLGGRLIQIPTLHPSPMEDIPSIVSQTASSHGSTVIDPHNSHRDGFASLSREDVEEIARVIELASRRRDALCGPLKVGFRRMIPIEYGLSDGLGPAGLCLLGIEVDGNRLALAVVDGNNATPEVRPAVIERLRRRGWNHVELLTTDTHIVNGITMGGRGYSPIGERIPAIKIAELFCKLADEVAKSLEPAEVGYLSVTHRAVPVFSSQMLERLASRARRSIYFYVSLMAISVVLALPLT